MNDSPIGTLRVFTSVTSCEMPIYEGFKLDQLVKDVRHTGYWFNGLAYVPHDKILAMVIVPGNMGEMTDSGQVRSAMQ